MYLEYYKRVSITTRWLNFIDQNLQLMSMRLGWVAQLSLCIAWSWWCRLHRLTSDSWSWKLDNRQIFIVGLLSSHQALWCHSLVLPWFQLTNWLATNHRDLSTLHILPNSVGIAILPRDPKIQWPLNPLPMLSTELFTLKYFIIEHDKMLNNTYPKYKSSSSIFMVWIPQD